MEKKLTLQSPGTVLVRTSRRFRDRGIDALVSEFAGILGVNPNPFTLRKLVWMIENKGKFEWSQTASLIALAVNLIYQNRSHDEQTEKISRMTLRKITEWNREKSPNESTVQSGFFHNSTVMTNYRTRIADELLAYKLSAMAAATMTTAGSSSAQASS